MEYDCERKQRVNNPARGRGPNEWRRAVGGARRGGLRPVGAWGRRGAPVTPEDAAGHGKACSRIKDSVAGFESRLNSAHEWIGELKSRSPEWRDNNGTPCSEEGSEAETVHDRKAIFKEIMRIYHPHQTKTWDLSFRGHVGCWKRGGKCTCRHIIIKHKHVRDEDDGYMHLARQAGRLKGSGMRHQKDTHLSCERREQI